ncbi:adaptive-response sensory-kinase SasA [mine drainage metagenome]|uniref:histidine kinase n=1 Tax=mine drainage metagenome TaxID=410659 RepID=A0A1J5PYA9_9ZZZZ
MAATNSLFECKALAIIKNITPGLPCVFCDRDRIVQVIINLLSNAVKFTDSGSVTVMARNRLNTDYQLENGGNFIAVSVSDSGIGIADKDFNHVFEKFKQVGDTLTDRPKGTGLGLPICKQIVESHGGKIWVDSNFGHGSVFTFILPTASETAEISYENQ